MPHTNRFLQNRDRPKDRQMSEVIQEIYAGPTDFLEAGSRGFLVTTLPSKEEFALDDAMSLLRQATIKIYGGIKTRSKTVDENLYVNIDFADPATIIELPLPEGEEPHEEPFPEPEKEREKKEEDASMEPEEKSETKQTDDAQGATEEGKTAEGEGDRKEEGDADKNRDGESRRDRRDRRDRSSREERKKKIYVRMRSTFKFKCFRTEIRNIMFIKSNVPDPMLVAEAAMEVVAARKSVYGDAVCQLLPVLGVCNYDYFQLEVMARRVLASVFDVQQEPKGFNVLVHDKLSEPGSDLLQEILRNSIWAVNPLAWLCSTIAETDVDVRLELIGSKLVLSCLKNPMKYRQYSPLHVVELGYGEGEDDDGGWMNAEEKKQHELWKIAKENLKKIEKEKEEERRKEREKRKEEQEKRRKEKEKINAEREKERAERHKKREEERREANKKREERRKEEKRRQAEKEKSKKEGEKKSSEGDAPDEWMVVDETEDVEGDEGEGDQTKQEGGTNTEAATAASAPQAEGGEDAKTKTAGEQEESPPKKKQRLESAEQPEEVQEEEKEEEEQEEEEKTPTKTRRGTRAGRRKAK